MHEIATELAMPAASIGVRSVLRDGTLRLETSGPLAGQWFRLTLRVTPPVHLAASASLGPDDDPADDDAGSIGWAMAPPSDGNPPPDDAFARAIVHAEANVRELAGELDHPWRGYGLALVELRAILRAAARAALAACDRDALGLAARFHPAARWFVYGAGVEDATGRIAQLARACPGVLVLGAALRRRGRGEAVEGVLRAVVGGAPLRAVVDRAVAAWAEAREHEDETCEWPPSLAGPDRDRAAQRLLVRRASASVDPEDLFARPVPAFAPEDVPDHPDRNAAWFRAMAGASRALARADDAGSLSAFASRHHRALLSAARRLPRSHDPDDPPGDALERLVARLVEWCRRTGRRPGRRSNPARILAEARRWARDALDASSAEARLGALLGRVRKLGLGEVEAVRELSGPAAWGRVGDLALPGWPHADVRVRGVSVEHVGTAAALAREGEELRHCVATTLRDVMAGHLHVFAVRAGASRLTLALRPRLLGGYELAELRGLDDRAPFPAETAAACRWVDAVNARVRMEGGPAGVTAGARGSA